MIDHDRQSPVPQPCPAGAALALPDGGDLLQFDDEPEDDGAPGAGPGVWTVLVVDDDRDVHDATRLALAGEHIGGRPLHLIGAYSAAEARRMLDAGTAVDVVLLDIVMETPDAGLVLARVIASDPRFQRIKVLVRTGQPGFWQDDAVRRLPGVHGYVTKAGLTRIALLDALIDLLPG